MKALAIFGGTVGYIAIRTLAVMWDGYVLTVLWGWFIVPTFGAPPLKIPAAIGLSIIVAFTAHQYTDCVQPERTFGERLARATTYSALVPACMLLVGWIVKAFL